MFFRDILFIFDKNLIIFIHNSPLKTQKYGL